MTHTKTPAARAASFTATRRQHLVERAEDYTELIADLIAEYGEARVGQIAKHLGISHVTALRTIQRLEKEGYVSTSPHQPVVLTHKGSRVAKFAKARHQLLVEFLCELGVSAKVAEIDVEGIEHHISTETLRCMKRHLRWYRETRGDDTKERAPRG
jgi:DtxR family transcriptional regulator, manganese transport regulator